MSIQYSARLQRRFEQLDPAELIDGFAVRPLTVRWPRQMHHLAWHLANKASAEIGRTSRSRLVSAAVCRIGMEHLGERELEGKIIGYRSMDLDSLLPDDAEETGNLPNEYTGFRLPEPIHALMESLQWEAYAVRPNLSEITGMAVADVSGFDRAQAGKMVLDYARASVGDIAPTQ